MNETDEERMEREYEEAGREASTAGRLYASEIHRLIAVEAKKYPEAEDCFEEACYDYLMQ